jgi:hypothetical protein
MWWRALGVAVVLLCAGVAGGYAVADRTQHEPVGSTTLAPITAVSPAVPTPPAFTVVPDPTEPPLAPDQPNHEEQLRTTARGPGISIFVPDDWRSTRQPDSRTWTFVPASNVKNTYILRVELRIGDRLDVSVAKTARMLALQSALEDGNITNLQISAETDSSFRASYIDAGGFLRVTMERWVGDSNGTAYADIAVTGRTVDEEGLADLLARSVESVHYLEALPPKGSEDAG